MEWNLVNGHLTISGEITHTTNKSSDWPWSSQVENIQSVSFSNAYFTSGSNAYGMFEDCESLTSLDLSSFDTSNVTSMCSMFDSCESLTSLDLSNFNTSNVTDMSYMFYDCDSLTSLDLSSFDTSNVTSMHSMFDFCDALTSLDLSNFNTSNVTTMSYMFSDCSSLTSLDLSNFNTSKVTYMERMFLKCTALSSILWSTDRYEKTKDSTIDNTKNYYILNLSTNKYEKVENPINENIENYYNFTGFNTSNVTSMWSMFDYCDALTSLDLSSFDTSNVISMCSMFSNCHSLTSLDLSNFNTSNVTDMSSMFFKCTALLYIRISNLWTTVKVSDSSRMFNSCTNLPNYNSSSTDKTRAYAGANGYLSDDVCACYNHTLRSLTFEGCYKNQYYNTQTIGENTYYVGFETTQPDWNDKLITTVNFNIIVKPETTFKWFCDCTYLTTFNNLQLLDTSNVINMSWMFSRCSHLTSLDLSSFDTSKVEDMDHMLFGCNNLTSLNLNSFDTSKVEDMNHMFCWCRYLISLDLRNFNTSSVTDMSNMFDDCEALTSLKLSSSFDTSNVTNMSYMFYSCIALTSLDLSNFDISSVTNMNYMFQYSSVIIPVLYVCQTQCTTYNFAKDSQGIIYLVRDPEVAENTAVRDFWRSVASSYDNVHFEYDDATRPIVTSEISRGKLVNNQWQADESGNTIKIKLNEQVYNNNISSVLSENKLLISYEEIQNPTGNPSEQGWYEKNNEEYIQTNDTQVILGKTYYNKNTGINIEIPTAVNYVVKQDLTNNNLFYITLNTNPDKQYDVNVILTDLSGIPVTRVVIAPGVFAMIEFKAGGHGMSIGKICERDGLEVSIPTTIGKGLLPPVDQHGNFDLTNYQLVIGKYNKQKNEPLFIIGNGTDDTHRSNLMEVGENEITIGKTGNPQFKISSTGMEGLNDNQMPYFRIRYDGAAKEDILWSITGLAISRSYETINLPDDIKTAAVLRGRVEVSLSSQSEIITNAQVTSGFIKGEVDNGDKTRAYLYFEMSNWDITQSYSFSGVASLTVASGVSPRSITTTITYNPSNKNIVFNTTSSGPYGNISYSRIDIGNVYDTYMPLFVMGTAYGEVGGYSTVIGEQLRASSNNQVVIGKFNSNQSDNAFEIGNGTDTTRSNALTVGWNGNVTAAGDVNIASGKHYKVNDTDIFNLIYPVGSIYMSVNNINPGTLFGGEWTPIQNRFLFAAGSFHTAGTEGGSRYIQAHTHSFTGAAHTHDAGSKQAFLRYNQETVDLGVQERSVASGASGNYKAPVVNSANVDWSYISNTSSETVGGTVGAVTGATTGLSGSTAEGNMPPYLTVYMWKRTA